MRSLTWFTTLIAAPLAVLAVPADNTAVSPLSKTIFARQGAAAPPPCKRMNPPPSEAETRARFAQFVQVFVGPKKNIFKAFEFIAADYINHNPMARNGSASAWGILSPMWNSMTHQCVRATFQGDMSWVNYKAGRMGTIVDRFRWEAGCIAEHWDQGETYPSSGGTAVSCGS